MPRCLMAKKWKAYHWPRSDSSEEKLQPLEIKIKHESEEEEEEIDVVSIHHNGFLEQKSSAPNVQYQNPPSPPPMVTNNHASQSETPKLQPLQGYYRASPEDYPSPSPPKQEQIDLKSNTTDALPHHNLPTVIQHHSAPQQVRHTSVIHHSSSVSSQNNTPISTTVNRHLSNNNESTKLNPSNLPMQPQSSNWGPSSPTEGETAPSPPPHVQHSSQSERKSATFNNYTQNSDISHYSTFLPGENSPPSYAVNGQSSQTSLETTARPPAIRTRSLAMCFTSTGAALSLPPKKKDIYRPYSLDDRPSQVRWRPVEDITAAHAILDLSASPPAPQRTTQSPLPPALLPLQSPTPPNSPASAIIKTQTKTIAYTYEAFFVSDGRSKKKNAAISEDIIANSEKPKYTCSECGKQYATSSNLSRHKQTHRSLDSQSAKKCLTCGKAYVSMPALAMHLLTHKLNHACGICGKLFSRPWLLQGHLRSHTGEKPYGCAHCGKAFADRSNLRAHMQTHSADKNFECTRCHKTFALKSYLNKHLESACISDSDCLNSPMMPNHHIPPITRLQ